MSGRDDIHNHDNIDGRHLRYITNQVIFFQREVVSDFLSINVQEVVMTFRGSSPHLFGRQLTREVSEHAPETNSLNLDERTRIIQQWSSKDRRCRVLLNGPAVLLCMALS